jgi:Amt family ammonium transporter
MRNSLWVMLSAAMVLLMHFGLAIYYGGLVSARNALNTIKMSIITLGVVPILWWIMGYSLIFSPGDSKFTGDFYYSFFRHIDVSETINNTSVLTFAFICFQAMFASITPAIISGSGVERLKFNTYLIFIIIWELFVYCTVAHSIWNPAGWANLLGAFDFAGGIVVHVSAGFAALALAIVLKPRQTSYRTIGKNNLPLVVLGCGLLWFGWFGFNGGSSLGISKVTVLALANSFFAPAASMVVWMICDAIFVKIKSVTGVCSSVLVGLIAITPAAGYVDIGSSIAIGGISSFLTYVFQIFYNRYKHKVDDTLDVFVCHGIPGFLGGIMVGVFASHNVNPVIPDGVIYGNWDLVWKQILVTTFVAAFSFIVSFVLLKLLDRTVGLRVNVAQEISGLDSIEHGEQAYNNQKSS